MAETIYHRTPVFTHSTKKQKDVVEWYKPLMDYKKINEVSTGVGAKVAVLDDGIDRDHKYLEGRVKHVFEFTHENFEKGFHSTHVTGIMASKKHGIFPDIEIGCFKVLTAKDGFGTAEWIAKGIRGARIKGYEVINASLGGDINDRVVEKEIINFCSIDTFFFVCASGNDGKETDFPAALSKYVPGVISVGAVQIKDGEIQIAAFSSSGEVTIVAPGVEILSTLPDDDEGFLSGTSMAAAFISSMIGACKAIYPKFDHHTFNYVADKCTTKVGKTKQSGKGFIQMAEFMCTVKDIADGKIKLPEKPVKPLIKLPNKSIIDKVKGFFS